MNKLGLEMLVSSIFEVVYVSYFRLFVILIGYPLQLLLLCQGFLYI